MSKYLVLMTMLFSLLMVQPSFAQESNSCQNVFADAQDFTDAFVEETISTIDEDGAINWDTTDWENLVRRVVGSSEFYLNNCAEDAEAIEDLAALSLIKLPVSTLDLGSDFGEIELNSNFEPIMEAIDLNGDGQDEWLLHTQVPYFSQDTVYQIRGGVSVAFFKSEDGWQGQMIAPVSSFVTNETGPHVSFAMTDTNTLSTETAAQALIYLPAPEVEVLQVGDAWLTAITLHSTTGAGEAKELDIMTWDGMFPSVELRVAFDDWCYPGVTLDWEIQADGSVFVPSNGGDADSPLHCGQTPEVMFLWSDGQYTAAQ